MPAHPKAFDRLAIELRRADGDRTEQDRILDQWVDYRDRATEWDADQWGFTQEEQDMTEKLFEEQQ